MSADGGEGAEVDRVARLLMDAWERAEGTPVTVSYVATFADLARAVVADRDREREAAADRSTGESPPADAGESGVGGEWRGKGYLAGGGGWGAEGSSGR